MGKRDMKLERGFPRGRWHTLAECDRLLQRCKIHSSVYIAGVTASLPLQFDVKKRHPECD